MRVLFASAFVLLAVCWYADGWFSRRSSSSVTIRRVSSPTTLRRTSSTRRTVFDANVGINNGRPSLSAGITHQGNGWSGSVRGTIDTSGNWGVKAGITIPLGKRSVQNGNLYNLTLYVDPCNFDTFDDDRDGLIQKEELQAIFGDNEKTDALFADLDIVTGDGVIEQEEFHAVVPVTISACAIKEE